MKDSRSQKYFSRKPLESPGVKRNTPTESALNEESDQDSGFIIMDMPEVKDIPGQENIKPPRMREMADVTISSADEEGEGILDDLNKEDDDEDGVDAESNVSSSEKKLLAKADRPETPEQVDRKKLSLDKTDGVDLLNEEGDPTDLGRDLDVPGSELDDEDEDNGEEDEENNSYSKPD